MRTIERAESCWVRVQVYHIYIICFFAWNLWRASNVLTEGKIIIIELFWRSRSLALGFVKRVGSIFFPLLWKASMCLRVSCAHIQVLLWRVFVGAGACHHGLCINRTDNALDKWGSWAFQNISNLSFRCFPEPTTYMYLQQSNIDGYSAGSILRCCLDLKTQPSHAFLIIPLLFHLWIIHEVIFVLLLLWTIMNFWNPGSNCDVTTSLLSARSPCSLCWSCFESADQSQARCWTIAEI